MIVNRNHLINQMLFVVQEKKTEFEHFFDFLLLCRLLLPWPPLFLKTKNASADRRKLPSCLHSVSKSLKMSHLNCCLKKMLLKRRLIVIQALSHTLRHHFLQPCSTQQGYSIQ